MAAAEDLLTCAADIRPLSPRPQQTICTRIADFAPYLSEFLGSLLVAMVWNYTFTQYNFGHRCLVLGMTLLVATCALAPISGAHFNPAVSFATALAGHADWYCTVLYAIMQLFGSIVGVFLSIAIFGQAPQAQLGLHLPGFNIGAMFSVEFVYSGLICLTYLSAAVSRTNNPPSNGNQFFAVAIGFAMVAGVATGGDISGGIFNPALAAAVMLEKSPFKIWTFMGYLSAHFWGAMFAATVFRILRPAHDKRFSEWLSFMTEEYYDGMSAVHIFSEAVGSFLVVFTASLAMLVAVENSSTSHAWTIGSAVIALHYSLADLSGGYFNPAVTLSVVLSRRKLCSIFQGALYIIIQLISGTLATILAFAMNWNALSTHTKDEVVIGAVRTGTLETFYMNVVCLAVLTTSTARGIKTPLLRNNYYNGLAYGLAFIGAGFATFRDTGGLLVPSAAILVGTGHYHVEGFWAQSARAFISDICSGILAAVVFRLTYFHEYNDEPVNDTELNLGDEVTTHSSVHEIIWGKQRLKRKNSLQEIWQDQSVRRSSHY